MRMTFTCAGTGLRNMTDATSLILPVSSYQDHEALRLNVSIVFDAYTKTLEAVAGLKRDALVVVKPNWIQQGCEQRPDSWEALITHPNLVLAVVEVLVERMNGHGTICVCDAPHTYADFSAITARGSFHSRLQGLSAAWPNMNIECLDLRREVWIRRDQVVTERLRNQEDPRGYVAFNLGKSSLFYGHLGEGRYYGADYDEGVVNAHHKGDIQEYLLAGTPVKAHLFINLPKLKTHKKTGITCCLKNLVGINGDKNWLPHHVEGAPRQGGDESPDYGWARWAESSIKKATRHWALRSPRLGNWIFRMMRSSGKAVLGASDQTIRNGNWHGNDTCWRMALDLNRALLYGNADGSMRMSGPKPYIAIVDAIIGGEGNGPLDPDPVPSGVLVAGQSPAAVDAVAARLMGFNLEYLPIVKNAFEPHKWALSATSMGALEVRDERVGQVIPVDQVTPAVAEGFRPHFGWEAHLRATNI